MNICFVQSLCFESVSAAANQALFAHHALSQGSYSEPCHIKYSAISIKSGKTTIYFCGTFAEAFHIANVKLMKFYHIRLSYRETLPPNCSGKALLYHSALT